MNKQIFELPFQPGEASWASWKCDGGPHTDEQFPADRKSSANSVKTIGIDDVEIISSAIVESEVQVSRVVET